MAKGNGAVTNPPCRGKGQDGKRGLWGFGRPGLTCSGAVVCLKGELEPMLQLFRTLNSERALNAERQRRVRTQRSFHRSVSGPSNPSYRVHAAVSVVFFSKAPACFIPQAGYSKTSAVPPAYRVRQSTCTDINTVYHRFRDRAVFSITHCDRSAQSCTSGPCLATLMTSSQRANGTPWFNGLHRFHIL